MEKEIVVRTILEIIAITKKILSDAIAANNIKEACTAREVINKKIEELSHLTTVECIPV